MSEPDRIAAIREHVQRLRCIASFDWPETLPTLVKSDIPFLLDRLAAVERERDDWKASATEMLAQNRVLKRAREAADELRDDAYKALLTLQRHVREVSESIRCAVPRWDYDQRDETHVLAWAERLAALLPSLAEKETLL